MDVVQPRVAIYLRDFSGDEYDKQLDLCRAYGQLHFQAGTDDFDVYSDTGALGDEPLPGWRSLTDNLHADTTCAVICPELSAVCRGSADFIRLSGEFSSLGIPLVFIKDGLETNTPAGRVMLYAAELFLQLERNAAAAAIRDGMRALARTGRWLGGITPTGYTSVRSESTPNQSRSYMLEILPEQAETVKLIFSLFLRHDSLAEVTQALRDRNIVTKNGRAFSRFTIRQILENPVYMRADKDAHAYFTRLGSEIRSEVNDFDGIHGMMVYNKTLQKQGLSTRQREPEEWIVAVGAHEGLVDAAEWIAVQRRLEFNKSRATRRPKGDHGLLAGLLTCADCGSLMRPKLTPRYNADGEPVFFYLCEYKERSHLTECDIPNLGGNMADAAVADMVRDLDPTMRGLLPSRPKPPLTAEAVAAHEARLADLRSWIVQNEDDISRLVFTLIKAIDKSAYDEIIRQIDTLRSQNEALRAQITSLETLTEGHSIDIMVRNGLPALLNEWKTRFGDLTIAQKRAALRCLVDSASWDGETLLVHFLGGAQCELSFE